MLEKKILAIMLVFICINFTIIYFEMRRIWKVVKDNQRMISDIEKFVFGTTDERVE